METPVAIIAVIIFLYGLVEFHCFVQNLYDEWDAYIEELKGRELDL